MPLSLRALIDDAKAGALEISYFARSSFAKICFVSFAASLNLLLVNNFVNYWQVGLVKQKNKRRNIWVRLIRGDGFRGRFFA